MNEKLVRFSEPNKLTFVGELLAGKTYSPKMVHFLRFKPLGPIEGSPLKDHLVCFIAGTLALGTLNGFPKEHLDLARAIGHTCHEVPSSSPSHLRPIKCILGLRCTETRRVLVPRSPTSTWWKCRQKRTSTSRSRAEVEGGWESDGKFVQPLDAHSLLRPEAIEAWFYLHRITGEKQYQEWGWEAFQVPSFPSPPLLFAETRPV